MILFNGCSFTYGDELKDSENTCFAALAGKKLNQDFKNLGTPGGSNHRIVRTTFANLDENIKAAVIQWTSPTRFEHFAQDSLETNDGYRKVTLQKLGPIQKHHDRTIWRIFHANQYSKTNLALKKYAVLVRTYRANCIEFLYQVHQIQTTLRLANIPYFMVNGLKEIHQDIFPDNLSHLRNSCPVYNKIDWSDKVWLLDPKTDSIEDWTKRNNYAIGVGEHPLEEAHDAFSDIIQHRLKDKI